MPKFKVVMEQPRGIYRGGRPINPFLIRDVFDQSLQVRMLLREFIFDAESESDARRFYEEAQKEGIGNVKGFKLRSIEQIG